MTKRIVSLLMAIALMLGVFAIPALAAAPDDTAEPYGVTIPCERCGAPAYRTAKTENVVIWVEKGNCTAKPNVGHNHTLVNYYYLTSCSKCSWFYKAPPYKTVPLPCK